MPAALRPVLKPLDQDLNPTPNSNYPAPSFLWMRADALKKMPQPLKELNPPSTTRLYISVPDPKYTFPLSKAPQKDHRIPTLSILQSFFTHSTMSRAAFPKPSSPC